MRKEISRGRVKFNTKAEAMAYNEKTQDYARVKSRYKPMKITWGKYKGKWTIERIGKK